MLCRMNTAPLELQERLTGSDPAARPVASIIVLHGLGADGSDFIPLVPELDLARTGPVRFIFPSAPVRPVTINGGYPMRAWYDIFPPSQDPLVPRREDEAGLRASQAQVQQLLDREAARGVPPERTVLMGFSQGCAMTLLAGLRAPQRLAGLVGLSGYLPLAAHTAAEASQASQGLPIFLAHGTQDGVVNVARGAHAREVLQQLSSPVSWHTYAMGHTVCAQEVADLNAWLNDVLTAS
jgi:phospholipase/carboxylesterase